MDFTTQLAFSTKALRHHLRQLLNLDEDQVRSAEEPFDTGDKPFISVRMNQSTPIGVTRITYHGHIETERLQDSYTSLISINAYGTGAYALMQRLCALMRSSYSLSELKKMHTGLLNISPIRNLSGEEGAGYEERAQTDLTFMHAHLTETPLKYIETVPVQIDTTTHQTQTTITKE